MLAMPSYTNPMGNIFGGYIMSVMDAAALMTATKVANGTVVTVAVSNMTFLEPVRVGDAICCYTDVITIGTTLITFVAAELRPTARQSSGASSSVGCTVTHTRSDAIPNP